MPTAYKPEGSVLPVYDPKSSVVSLYPAAIKMASVIMLSEEKDENGISFRDEILRKFSANADELKDVIDGYIKYFAAMFDGIAKEDVFESMQVAGFDVNSNTFQAFQSCVGNCMMSIFHERICNYSELEPLYCRDVMGDVMSFLKDRHNGVPLEGNREAPLVEPPSTEGPCCCCTECGDSAPECEAEPYTPEQERLVEGHIVYHGAEYFKIGDDDRAQAGDVVMSDGIYRKVNG